MSSSDESSSESDSNYNELDSEHSDRSSESVSSVEALEWDNDIKEESNPENTTLKNPKQKSFMYIVMQLCLKDTLRDWLRNNSQRKRETVLSIFSQICTGGEYVHSQNLDHRNLKPSNIYFSTDGTIKIGDFGLVTDGEPGDSHHSSPSHGAGGGDTQHTDQPWSHILG